MICKIIRSYSFIS
uniref:Uncharacterized protein n=1 Tax=Anguilla anguilla TaxID=7936 RepID=A0A0E9P5H7_ANGAN